MVQSKDIKKADLIFNSFAMYNGDIADLMQRVG